MAELKGHGEGCGSSEQVLRLDPDKSVWSSYPMGLLCFNLAARSSVYTIGDFAMNGSSESYRKDTSLNNLPDKEHEFEHFTSTSYSR